MPLSNQTFDQAIVSKVAARLHLPEATLIQQSLRSFLEQQLRAINAEILILHMRYNISSVEAMEARYQEGSLDEADSWRDWQRLDKLEYQRDELTKLLQSLQ